MLITEIRQCLWQSDQLHKEWAENTGTLISSKFSFTNREEFYHWIRLNGAAENKNKVAFWSVTMHDSCYFGGGRYELQDIPRRTDGGLWSCKFRQNALSSAWWQTSGASHPQETSPTWLICTDSEIPKNRRPSLNFLDFIQFGGPEDLQYERLNFSPVTESQFYFYSEICFDT